MGNEGSRGDSTAEEAITDDPSKEHPAALGAIEYNTTDELMSRPMFNPHDINATYVWSKSARSSKLIILSSIRNVLDTEVCTHVGEDDNTSKFGCELFKYMNQKDHPNLRVG